jgi:hypothetical protein
MKTAFVKVWLGSWDLSTYVESLRYDRSNEKDDYVNIRIKDNPLFDLANDSRIVNGALLNFQYGFLQGIPSPIHVTKITDIKVSYRGAISIELKCLDKGNTIKQDNSNVSRSGLASSIAQEIADKYGMTLETQPNHTYKSYKSLPQAFKSDFELLEYMAQKEGGFEVFVNSNTLVFRAADLGKKAKRLFTFGKDLISLSIELRGAHRKKALSSIASFTIDRDKKSLKAAFQSSTYTYEKSMSFKEAQGISNTMTLDGYRRQFDDIRSSPKKLNDRITKERLAADERFKGRLYVASQQVAANILNENLGKDNDRAWKETKEYLKQNFGTDDLSSFTTESDRKGNIIKIIPIERSYSQNPNPFGSFGASGGEDMESENKKARKKILTATLEIELDTSFNVGDIVTLSGVAKAHSGNWYVSDIDDSIGQGAATTRLSLTRDSSNGKMTVESGKTNGSINNSKGKEEGGEKNKSELRFKFDSKGNYENRYAKYDEGN